MYNNTRSHQIVSKNGRLLQLLTEKSGEPVLNYAQAEVLYNIVVLQKDLGLQMPAWLTDKVLAEMRQLAITSLATFTDTPFMQKIRGGNFF